MDPDCRLVVIQNVDPTAFESVLEYIYTGRFAVNDNLVEFTKIVMKMEMTTVAGNIDELLERSMDASNCFQIWKHATANSKHSDLPEKAYQFLLHSFLQPGFKGQLRDMTLPELLQIINDNDLPTETEEGVVRRGLEWLKARSVRGADAAELFKNLRLPLTSLQFITDEVEVEKVVKENEECRRIVDEAKRCLSSRERRHEFTASNIIYRKHNPYREVLVVVGGYKFGGDRANDVLALNFADKHWHVLAPLPHHPGRGLASVVYDNDIYITGGTRDAQACWRYISQENRWAEGPPMEFGRLEHTMEVVDGVLYSLGGDGEEEEGQVPEVERFNTRGREGWEVVGNLVLPVSGAASCAAPNGSKIFLFGGKFGEADTPTEMLQCFDLKTFQGTVLPTRLPVPCKGARGQRTLFAFYLFSTDGTLVEFDPDSAQVRKTEQVPHFRRKRFGMACHHERLLVVGGEDGDIVYRDMLCVRLNDTTSQLIPWDDFLPPVRAHMTMAKIVVPKENLQEAVWSFRLVSERRLSFGMAAQAISSPTAYKNPKLIGIQDVEIDKSGKFKYILIKVHDPDKDREFKFIARDQEIWHLQCQRCNHPHHEMCHNKGSPHP
nr:hypothetical protein BaRGS_030659 [Batillaria attramentaria]